jgi:nucleotide-binding universal stress UspA family protein
MKTILAVTDFSKASRNALLYSLKLAKAFDAKLILFHAFQQIAIPSIDSTAIITPEDIKSLVRKKLQQQLDSVNNTGHFPVEIRYEEGPAGSSILAEAALQKADIIVSGMKRSGKLFRQVFGSTVTYLASHTQVPMIVVPENAIFIPPGKIALASDIAPEPGANTLDILTEIGLQFQSKIYIIRVSSNRFEEVYELHHPPAKFSCLSKVLDTHYEYSKSRHITEALNAYIEGNSINMMTLVPHKHTLTERCFFKSNTRSMIFNSRVPLLILPEQR